MKLFRNTYRTDTLRLRHWDYASSGYYFVTICTKNRIRWFGEVQENTVRLSDVGCIVEEEWKRMGALRKNVSLDAWIIMPNHIHGIIRIDQFDVEVLGNNHVGAFGIVEAPLRGASTMHASTWRCISTIKIDTSMLVAKTIPLFRLRPNSLGSIINVFKGVCTRRIRNMGYEDFAWQERYYDRIIRNHDPLCIIRSYIRNNPIMWSKDRNNLL